MANIKLTITINQDETRVNTENKWYIVMRAFVTINGKRLHPDCLDDEEDLSVDLMINRDNYTEHYAFEVIDSCGSKEDYAVLWALMKVANQNLYDYLEDNAEKFANLIEAGGELNENLNRFEETFEG